MKKALAVSAVFIFSFFISCILSAPAHAASTFEVSGWMPYWRAATSSADVLPHLNQLTEINPFGYIVKSDGTLFDAANLESATSSYAAVIAAARTQHVRVIPTVMWSDTGAIDTILSNPTLRAKHVAAIVAMVTKNNWDGVDIDYEGKKASDINYFSAFLKQLYTDPAMKNKWVDCTIEARTPPTDLNTNTPASQILYANDLTQINKYCDRVRLMTYDQESVDKTLNKAAGNSIYTPIADPKWVTAVVELMEKSISPSKIELGVATYGYEYDVTPYANHAGYLYTLLWAFNPTYATQLAATLHIEPMRDSAGELAFTYPEPVTPSSAASVAPSGTGTATPTNANTLSASAVNASVSSTATGANMPLPGTERYVTWSDSVAIAQKIALAKQLGLRGIAIFKLDGGEDQTIWNILPVQQR